MELGRAKDGWVGDPWQVADDDDGGGGAYISDSGTNARPVGEARTRIVLGT